MKSDLCEIVKSVGIDIGTTTTQFVISELTVKNVAPGSLIPRLQITDKIVTYKSDIHFTPIKNDYLVDTEQVFTLIRSEFDKAGVNPADIDTGAVIITGETAKKENARSISAEVAGFAGDFVVATAGGKLESIIAGKGSGAASYSKNHFCTVANIDIGGGTSNIGIYTNGQAVDSCCINIGGRLLQLDATSGKLSAISKPMQAIIADCNLKCIAVGEKISIQNLNSISKRMAEVILEHLQKKNLSSLSSQLLMTDPLHLDYSIDAVMISGGVAETVYNQKEVNSISSIAVYGDVGPLLGKHVFDLFQPQPFELIKPTETIRATVIGAGAQTVDVSGSTILVNNNAILPIKNIPVVLPFVGKIEMDETLISHKIENSIDSFYEKDSLEMVAVGFQGIQHFSFKNIQTFANGIFKGLEKLLRANLPVIVVLEQDVGKVLGQSLRAIDPSLDIICVDQLTVNEGDYIDIGKSIAGGTVVPVIIKTLIFETEQV